MNFGINPVLDDLGIVRPGKLPRPRSIGWIIVLIFAIVLAFGLNRTAAPSTRDKINSP